MKKTFQRVLAVLLCAVLLCGAAPLGAWAADGSVGEKADASFSAETQDALPEETPKVVLEVGEPATIPYGRYVRIRARASGVPNGYRLGVVEDGELLYLGSDNRTVEYNYGLDQSPRIRRGADPIIAGDMIAHDLTLRAIKLLVFYLFDMSVKEDFEYTIVLMDAYGNLLRGDDGQPIAKTNQVTVSKRFGDRAKHFFDVLFFQRRWETVGVQEAFAD